MNFSHVDNIYQNKQSVINIHKTVSQELNDLHISLNKLRIKMGDLFSSIDFMDFSKTINKYRRDHVHMPIPLCNLGTVNKDEIQIVKEYFERSSLTYPSYMEQFKDLEIAFDKCLNSKSNPLLDKLMLLYPNITSLLKPSSLRDFRNSSITFCVAPKYVNFIKETFVNKFLLGTNAYISDRYIENLFVSPGKLKDNFVGGDLIMFTNTDSFTSHWGSFYRYGWLLETPRSHNYQFLSFNFMKDRWRPESLITDSQMTENIKIIVHNNAIEQTSTSNLNTNILEEEFDDSNFEVGASLFDTQDQTELSDSEYGKQTVMSKLVLLEGERKVWLDINTRVLCINDDRISVDRVDVSDLEVGMFYLYREDVGDFIPNVADVIMGDKTLGYRNVQQDWKSRLNRRVEMFDIDFVIDELKKLGSRRAKRENIINWVNPRTIKPESKNDFMAIMKLINYQSPDRVWEMMNQIDKAHKKAGVNIKNELLEKIKNTENLSGLLDDGWEKFEINVEGAGILIAREINKIFEENFEKSINIISKVYKWED